MSCPPVPLPPEDLDERMQKACELGVRLSHFLDGEPLDVVLNAMVRVLASILSLHRIDPRLVTHALQYHVKTLNRKLDS